VVRIDKKGKGKRDCRQSILLRGFIGRAVYKHYQKCPGFNYQSYIKTINVLMSLNKIRVRLASVWADVEDYMFYGRSKKKHKLLKKYLYEY
jgi:hypothetical protein